MEDILKRITAKKKKLDSLKPLQTDLVADLDKWFEIELTSNSIALPGNTRSREEIALIIEST